MTSMSTLPGDDLRQVMWRFSDRYDLQMVVQSARSIARGVVARMVADGARKSHEWNDCKAGLLEAFDQSGLTALYMDPEQGGFIEGPKNLAMALTAFELAWVDAGSATCSLATYLALAPIHEKGTPEQRDKYMRACVPPQPGEDRVAWRGAFALTEPLPYVGVDTGVLQGKVRVEKWEEGEEPMLKIDKRGRFITNMCFANFATVALDSDDERIKGSCMAVIEEDDTGVFDRGSPTLKMVHQLSSTRDPVFNVTVPASRIIGGYTVEDGKIVPNYSHGEVIASVFHRTRIPVGLMTSAKLLSAVEPIIRYHRQRFRGGDAAQPGSPRFDLGLQQKEDALHRLLEIWASGEAGASLGFAAARGADEFDPTEREVENLFDERGVPRGRKRFMELRKAEGPAKEYIEELKKPETERDRERMRELWDDPLTRYVLLDSVGNVLIPACKLWNTGHGATMMREAVALMGGYGITEDCPGFLGMKWMDAQLEATYEGPEAVQRRHLTATMGNEVFLVRLDLWTEELKLAEAENPGMGADVLAKGIELWKWTYDYLGGAKDPEGKKLLHAKRQGVTFPMADALSWLMAAKCLLDDVLAIKARGPESPVLAGNLDGILSFYSGLSSVQATRAAGEAARIAAELVYGYVEAPDLEAAQEFERLRAALDASMAGSRLAKERAANMLAGIMIPEALDYPL
jgi:alkylation response protein AidB-like acyl-CoA dehydrogenase